MSNKFEKGRQKTGGRQKGTPNRTTAEIREFLQQIYDNNLSTLQGDLMEMSPFQRQQILDKVAAKFLPNLTKNENDTMMSGGLDINISYDEAPPNKNDDDEED